MISVCITMAFMVHLVACMFFMIARLNNFVPESWVYRKGIIEESSNLQYLFSVDWAI